VAFEQLRYVVGLNTEFLADIDHIVLVGEVPPVSFFAYPGMSSTPDAPGTTIDRLCFEDWDIMGTLQGLADALGVTGNEDIARLPLAVSEPPEGPLTPERIGEAIALTLPEDAVVTNEAVTAGFGIWPRTATSRPHDRINNTGGSIGQCLPCAVGVAIACPDRRVLAVTGDGSAMYTIQSLWTMARERLDITVVVLANRGYQILRTELENVGVPKFGRNAARMFDVEDPVLNFVALAEGHGVPGTRVETAKDLVTALETSYASQGPSLIEVAVAS
jgi:acetolactate synthase-1/2/3 large subunit